jgi:hypothetical protein
MIISVYSDGRWSPKYVLRKVLSKAFCGCVQDEEGGRRWVGIISSSLSSTSSSGRLCHLLSEFMAQKKYGCRYTPFIHHFPQLDPYLSVRYEQATRQLSSARQIS